MKVEPLILGLCSETLNGGWDSQVGNKQLTQTGLAKITTKTQEEDSLPENNAQITLEIDFRTGMIFYTYTI